MTIAIRQKVFIEQAGRIEILSPELQPGAAAEVIVLLETSSEARSMLVRELKELFKTTQALPQSQSITEEEIVAEIATYRATKQ